MQKIPTGFSVFRMGFLFFHISIILILTGVPVAKVTPHLSRNFRERLSSVFVNYGLMV